MTKAIAGAAVLIALTSAAAAQLWLMSPAGQAYGTASGAPPPPTCAGSQFDFSDTAGCNILAGVEILPL